MQRLLYNFKITFKNKELIFWTFGFPIIMATLFYFAFSNIIPDTGFSTTKVAFVDSAENQLSPAYHLAIEGVEEVETKFTDNLDDAKAMLQNDEVASIIYFENATDYPKILARKNGGDATVIQNIMTEAEQMQRALQDGRLLLPANVRKADDASTDYIMVEFYTLLAMACLYGGMIATKTTDKNLANMTASGKRIAVSAVSKTKIILGGLLTSYIVQLIGLTLLFAYLTLVLRLNFGPNLPTIIPFTMVGALAGLTLGMFVSVVFKVSENTKDGILSGITMLGCFFGGMMGPSMKYLTDTSMPIVNKINPSAIISDGYYAITSGDAGRLWFNIASLLIFTAILSVISIAILRRQKYDSL